MQRDHPPEDISPLEFFTRWLPSRVEADGDRRARLGDTVAFLVFVLEGEEGGEFTLHLEERHARTDQAHVTQAGSGPRRLDLYQHPIEIGQFRGISLVTRPLYG